MKKNFFVKSSKQKEAFQKSVENFGKHEISFVDAVVGSGPPTGTHHPYAESTFVRIIIPPL